MELCAHGVVVVSGHGADERAVLPVPDSDRLIVGTGNDPWEFGVEEDGAHVVQMSVEGEETPPRLVAPHLDLVIISS